MCCWSQYTGFCYGNLTWKEHQRASKPCGHQWYVHFVKHHWAKCLWFVCCFLYLLNFNTFFLTASLVVQLVMNESAWNAGDPGSISGLGRSSGEGIGYWLQDSWASLMAQLVKNPPAMQETWLGLIPGLGRSPGEENSYPLSYSGLENSMDCVVHGVAKSRLRNSWLSDIHFSFHIFSKR